ncbi:hypothetical protein BDV35DRAFT_243192 [Aspergillus flavus]|uniref:Uncharacterized protein n=1 Tax=Aspergillus flavus TaxID=5059 RepID=A0A5N6GWB3_ASPFL|nr:hypothetical protein BDV35DRAFT_243192 [Aspergillus flavus]
MSIIESHQLEGWPFVICHLGRWVCVEIIGEKSQRTHTLPDYDRTQNEHRHSTPHGDPAVSRSTLGAKRGQKKNMKGNCYWSIYLQDVLVASVGFAADVRHRLSANQQILSSPSRMCQSINSSRLGASSLSFSIASPKPSCSAGMRGVKEPETLPFPTLKQGKMMRHNR